MKRMLRPILLITLLTSAMLFAAEPFFSLPVGTIVLDAGHGGKDPGAVTNISVDNQPLEIYEKDINMVLVEKVGTLLEELYPGIEVIYTRTGDDYISLWERSQIANSYKAIDGKGKVFISIHVNAAGAESASGFEIWKLQTSIAKDFFTTSLSESGILKMTESLNSSLNQELDQMSTRLAQSIETAMTYSLPSTVRNRGIKEGSFYVLHNSIMPAVLIETGFMTNAEEIRRLIDPNYQEILSEGIAVGIMTYLESLETE